jgi:uncharacterized protein
LKKKVEFFSTDWLTVVGELYLPMDVEENGTFPAIVLCQGLSGIKEKVLPEIAETFREAGYVVLAFDYRGEGESDDTREKPYLFPLERAEDAFYAVSYIKSLPYVDEHKIGLYGLSYGAPIAIYVAALDKRIRCVVAVSSPVGGDSFMSSLRKQRTWVSFQKEVEDDRLRRLKTGKSRLVPLEKVVPFPDSFWEKYNRLDNKNKNESIPENGLSPGKPMLSLESAEAMIRFRPDCFVNLVAPAPLLFIHGETDDVAHIELTREMYQKAGKPKKFVALPNMDHIDLDTGGGLQQQVKISLKWFKKYL